VARTTIDELLADARRRLSRLEAAEALRAMRSGQRWSTSGLTPRSPGTAPSRERS
jgi:hypothetical protein